MRGAGHKLRLNRARKARRELLEWRRLASAFADLMTEGHNTVCFDKTGAPISFGNWMVLFEDNEYRQIAVTDLGRAIVSTVWMGQPTVFQTIFGGRNAPPLIFETQVFFKTEDCELNLQRFAYCTLAEAETGHQHVASLVAGYIEQTEGLRLLVDGR